MVETLVVTGQNRKQDLAYREVLEWKLKWERERAERHWESRWNCSGRRSWGWSAAGGWGCRCSYCLSCSLLSGRRCCCESWASLWTDFAPMQDQALETDLNHYWQCCLPCWFSSWPYLQDLCHWQCSEQFGGRGKQVEGRWLPVEETLLGKYKRGSHFDSGQGYSRKWSGCLCRHLKTTKCFARIGLSPVICRRYGLSAAPVCTKDRAQRHMPNTRSHNGHQHTQLAGSNKSIWGSINCTTGHVRQRQDNAHFRRQCTFQVSMRTQ